MNGVEIIHFAPCLISSIDMMHSEIPLSVLAKAATTKRLEHHAELARANVARLYTIWSLSHRPVQRLDLLYCPTHYLGRAVKLPSDTSVREIPCK